MKLEGLAMKCGACGSKIGAGPSTDFHGVPVCGGCSDELGLQGIASALPCPFLADHIEEGGEEASKGLRSLTGRVGRDEGWRLLSSIHGMICATKDPAAKELLRGGLVLVSTSIIEHGTEEGMVGLDTKRLTLSLVLGEVLCLSMMKRISSERGLGSGSRLDDVLIRAQHNLILNTILFGLRERALSGHEDALSSAVWSLMG